MNLKQHSHTETVDNDVFFALSTCIRMKTSPLFVHMRSEKRSNGS